MNRRWLVEVMKTQVVYFEVDAETEEEAMQKYDTASESGGEVAEYEVIACHQEPEAELREQAKFAAYDWQVLSHQLSAIAAGRMYHAAVLRVAKSCPAIDHVDMGVLDRWLTGAQQSGDGWALQEVALKVAEHGAPEPEPEHERIIRVLQEKYDEVADEYAGAGTPGALVIASARRAFLLDIFEALGYDAD
jgi:hypothetical protein